MADETLIHEIESDIEGLLAKLKKALGFDHPVVGQTTAHLDNALTAAKSAPAPAPVEVVAPAETPVTEPVASDPDYTDIDPPPVEE